MADHLLEHGSTRSTHQSEPMRPDQVANEAGGYVWEADRWTRLRRFLVLGTEGGSYYADERKLTRESVALVRELAATDGIRLVDEVVQVSQAGRAPKNDEALYALAVAIAHGDAATKSKAAESLPLVARTGTHLFQFVAYARGQRGWGRTLSWALKNWFLSLSPDDLAYQAVKYRQRDGWSMRDLLRLGHPDDAVRRPIFDWIVSGKLPSLAEGVAAAQAAMAEGDAATVEFLRGGTPVIIEAFEAAQVAETPQQTAELVRRFRLPREALQTEHLKDAEVWRAMLEAGMPTGALIRNLATMTRLGVLEGEHRTIVSTQLASQDAITKARIHPLALLLGLKTYASGRGFRGTNQWAPIPAIIDALDAGFYLAFQNVEATGKRLLLAIDISGSMDASMVRGTPLSAREAAAALAMVTVAVEPNVDVVGFAAGTAGTLTGWARDGDSGPWPHRGMRDGLEPIGMSSRQRLDDVVQAMKQMRMGGTDCALPMLYAAETQRAYDGFVVYTDNETWAGTPHPAQALVRYRQVSGIHDARLAVVGMVANRFSIADPADAGMLDVVGLDTATPTLISEFVAGRV